MKLSQRMLTIIDFVNKNDIVADIGADHGLLAVALLLQEKVKYIYITDYNKLPLEVAKNNLIKYGINQKFILICEWGLKFLKQQIINTCIIAGMGANLIIDILADDSNNIERYIIQANNNVNKVRNWVKNNNYFIEAETIVYENSVYYEIIVINKKKGFKVLSNSDIVFGPLLRLKKSLLFINYYESKIKYWQKVLSKVKNSNENKEKILQEISLIKKELGW